MLLGSTAGRRRSVPLTTGGLIGVGMVECREDFGFALKPRQPFAVGRDRWRQNLDRHLTLQLGIGGAIHLPHPAFANLLDQLEDAEAGAGGEGQRLGWDYTGWAAAGTGLLLGDGDLAHGGRRLAGRAADRGCGMGGELEGRQAVNVSFIFLRLAAPFSFRFRAQGAATVPSPLACPRLASGSARRGKSASPSSLSDGSR